MSYKETLVLPVYVKDNKSISAKWNEFPTTRIKIEAVAYEGVLEDNNNKPYSWVKFRISCSKLENTDDGVRVKQKSIKKVGFDWKVKESIVDDATIVVLSKSELIDLLNEVGEDNIENVIDDLESKKK